MRIYAHTRTHACTHTHAYTGNRTQWFTSTLLTSALRIASHLRYTAMALTGTHKIAFEKAYTQATDPDTTNTKVRTLLDEMLKILNEAGSITQVRIPPTKVGIHPDNRNGQLMSAHSMEVKGSKIVSHGFSPSLCGPDRAICFPEKDGRVHAHMAKMCPTSDKFAPLQTSYLAGSVGCGHLNQFLAAVATSRPTGAKGLTDPNGLWETSKMKHEDPNLAAAIDQGLLWSQVDEAIEAVYPKLPLVVQQVLNLEHHIGVGETWLQQLGSIGHRAIEGRTFDQIHRDVVKSTGPCVNEVTSHINFVKKWGGGAKNGMFLLKETTDFLQMAMPDRHHVSGDFLHHASSLRQSVQYCNNYFIQLPDNFCI